MGWKFKYRCCFLEINLVFRYLSGKNYIIFFVVVLVIIKIEIKKKYCLSK